MGGVRDAGARFKETAVAVRGLLLWALFKLLQAGIAAAFSLIIVAQACVAGVLRFFGEPAALQRVRAAQLGSPARNPVGAREQGLKAGEKTGNIHIRAVVTDPSTIKPMHIFVDQRKGEEACKQTGPFRRRGAQVSCCQDPATDLTTCMTKQYGYLLQHAFTHVSQQQLQQ